MNTSYDAVTLTLNPALDVTGSSPRFTTGRLNRVSSVRLNPGGKGVNAAAALAGFGHSVAATGFLGLENSEAFLSLFREKKISDHFIRIEGSTRFSIKIVDGALEETTDLNFPGLAPSSTDITELQALLKTLEAPWYILAGSLPPGVPETIYRDLILDLKALGKKVAVDASGDVLRHAIEAGPDLIKPNLFELETLLGSPLPTTESVIAAARSILSQGVGEVVVSMDSRGACFVTRSETVIAVPPHISINSTVGAGDAMVAGLISARLNGLPPEDSARLATAFSLDVLSHEGRGLTSPEAVRAFLPEISLSSFAS